MSKSHPNPLSKILVTDAPEEIHLKIMSALTDSTNSVSYEPILRPGVSNLLQLLSCFDPEGRSVEDLAIIHQARTLKDFKALVSDAILVGLSGVRSRYFDVMAEGDGRYLDHVAEMGAGKARGSAESTMAIVRTAVGL